MINKKRKEKDNGPRKEKQHQKDKFEAVKGILKEENFLGCSIRRLDVEGLDMLLGGQQQDGGDRVTGKAKGLAQTSTDL